MKQFLLLASVFLLTCFQVMSQHIVTGKITEFSGASLPGVSVLLKGTSVGTVTNSDGNYSINAPEGVLVFTFIGYTPQEISIDGRASIDVVMDEDIATLEQIVFIGYGSQKKKNLTNAISVVGQMTFANRPVVSATEALQGKAAGVQVIQPSGKPGIDISVRVRGSTSVQAGHEPLYVIDGVPTTDVRGLNANDIETITVLKDASSASIYGARAANGVVLITTKRGVEDASNLNLMVYSGVSQIGKTIDLLNTEQYKALMADIPGITVDPALTKDYDWQKEIYGTGTFQNYHLTYSGGNEKNRHYVSAGVLKNKGIVRPSNYDRYTVHMNFDNEVNDWLQINTNLNLSRSVYHNIPDNLGSGFGGVILSALNTPPFLNIYSADGSYEINPFLAASENPVAFMEGPKESTVENRLFGNIGAEVKIIEGLSYKTNLGIDYTGHQYDYFLDPFKTAVGRADHGRVVLRRNITESWLSEHLLQYGRSFGDHNFTFMGGTTIQELTFNTSTMSGRDFPSVEGAETMNAANVVTSATGEKTNWAILSYLGRLNYDYNGKYLVTATIRRDGSSKFAPGLQWGIFPSVSAAWRVSDEAFMENMEMINDLKLRAGWGQNGNQEGINNYASYTQFSFARQTAAPLTGPTLVRESVLGNKQITWEKTTQKNIGVDFSMFESRLTVSLDAYLKSTDALLFEVPLPVYTGLDRVRMNAGKMENKGLEVTTSSVNTKGELQWNTDFNISFNRNKVVDMDIARIYKFAPISASNGNEQVIILRAGVPLGTFNGYIYDGVNPETGDPIFRDLNNNGIRDEGDRTVIGNAQPDFIYGITNTLSYKRFDLTVFLQGSQGNDLYNATRVELEGMFDTKNQSTRVLNRWTPSNPNTDIPIAGNRDALDNSSRFVENGSYMRVKSATLGYTPNPAILQKVGIKSLYIFSTVQNILTFTKYSGLDPEVNAYGVNSRGTEIGIDYGTYPQSKTYIFGVNITF